MNLIEKVAKAIKAEGDAQGYTAHAKAYDYFAKGAISAMPSIKWQKIETLPEEFKDGFKVFLAWDTVRNQPQACIWVGSWEHQPKYYTHWAEINTPEDE